MIQATADERCRSSQAMDEPPAPFSATRAIPQLLLTNSHIRDRYLNSALSWIKVNPGDDGQSVKDLKAKTSDPPHVETQAEANIDPKMLQKTKRDIEIFTWVSLNPENLAISVLVGLSAVALIFYLAMFSRTWPASWRLSRLWGSLSLTFSSAADLT